MQPTASTPSVTRRFALLVLIGALPFSDFLQTGVYAFNAAPIMGDIGASPEEYSLVATFYAVTAIGMIFNHRWLVERMGWRWFMRVASLLFAVGALVCAASEGLGTFAAGRLITALACASFFTAGRVLVNLIPPSPQRFTGVKFFASGIAWGAVCGPLLASVALSLQDWRLAFVAQLVPAVLLALLGELALPNVPPPARSPFDVRGLITLAGGSALVLFALQRSVFDFFSDRLPLYTYVTVGVPALVFAVWLVLKRELPAIRLREMSQRRYLIGLAAFAVCYALLGANNTAIPVLLLRGLNLPLEIIGRYVALGALGGVLVWILLSRLVPRHPGPTRYYVLGFSLLAACGLMLGGLSETVEPRLHVLPALLCNGAFVIAVLSTTAVQTFRDLQRDETLFSHANQVKNVLAQFGVAAGMCIATLFLQWRTTLHYVRVGESLGVWSAALQDTLRLLAQRYGAAQDPEAALRMATATVNGLLMQEATFMASLDYFNGIAALAGLCLLAVLAERAWRYGRQRRSAVA
ncbi:MFS transporter [Variovorax sp. YR216]|uniref:MFS transporter n=1 Tax=Variovorax sp. YR216 TaxID=1882828 RepID=UPI000899DF79|nr:MFS transporter [Variovorax sp. YR216]SEB25958.1 Major Facilitator Superfamily protein [Variovorax sp. YR216]